MTQVRMPFDGTYPIDQNWGNGGFGAYPNITDGHPGVDYGCPMQTPLKAIADGVVTHAGYADGFGADCVSVWHPQLGVTVLYGHCDAMYVFVGQEVFYGDHVADSDNEGASTGPHLHFEVRPINSPFGYNSGPPTGNIDPVAWLAANINTTPPDWLDTVDEATLRGIVNDETNKVLHTWFGNAVGKGRSSVADTIAATMNQTNANAQILRGIGGALLSLRSIILNLKVK